MPAKTQYLTSSGWTRFSKIMAAIFGGYVATILLHIAIAKNVANDTPVLLTSTFTTFLIWCGLMVLVFGVKKAWISWVLLIAIGILSSLFIFI